MIKPYLRNHRQLLGPLLLGLCVVATQACTSIERSIVNRLGDSLAAGGSAWASDDDPELIREALPFTLKTLETLVAKSPRNAELLLATCQGYTQYAGGFLELDAARVAYTDFRRARQLRARALNLYLRARDYCVRGLERVLPGATQALAQDPEGQEAQAVLSKAQEKDLPWLYWTAASWGAAIARGLDQPELLAEVPAVRALAEVALAVDPEYDNGALQEGMIVFESVRAMGGELSKAKAYFDRALQLSGGLKASPYVTYAQAVSVQNQDRKEFQNLLDQALAIDPRQSRGGQDTLANLLSQEKARILQSQVDEFFFEDEEFGDDGEEPADPALSSTNDQENP